MKIITLNVNGIRSAARKGFFEWMVNQDADVVCLQEVKAQIDDLKDDPQFYPPGYHVSFHCAEKKGYSGVAIYSKQKPENVITGLGWEIADKEGRYVEADFGKVCIASLYMPSGTTGYDRQQIKFAFLELYAKHLQDLKNRNKDFIICGDWNIAHKEIDLKNWKGNKKNSGFLPEERAWMDALFGELEYYDAFRLINKEEDQYTWWSNRGQAWAKNVGWRIDYQVVTAGLKDAVKSTAIYKQQRFSDHAPLTIEYDPQVFMGGDN